MHNSSNQTKAQSNASKRKGIKYTEEEAKSMVMLISYINTKCDIEFCFVQQCSFSKGLKIYGDRGAKAGVKEITQLHVRKCFHHEQSKC